MEHIFSNANLTLAHYAWEPEHNIVVLLSSIKQVFSHESMASEAWSAKPLIAVEPLQSETLHASVRRTLVPTERSASLRGN